MAYVKNKLDPILESARRSTHLIYLKIFCMASNPRGVSAKELAIELGKKPQTIHSMLERASARDVLIREKRGAEFRYKLHPSISRNDIEAWIRSLPEQDATALHHFHESGEVTLEEPKDVPSDNHEADSMLIFLAKKLPDFDLEWDEDRQNRWFALYEKLYRCQAKTDR